MSVSIKTGMAFDVSLSDEDFALIGKFIVTWNQVEMLMTVVVTIALGIDMTATEEIMSGPSVVPKTKILNQVVKATIHDEKIKEDTEKHSKEILSLSNFRNDIAHGYWTFDVSKKEPVSSRKLPSGHKLTTKQIREKLNQAYLLSMKMADVYYRVLNFRHPGAAPVPSPWHGKF